MQSFAKYLGGSSANLAAGIARLGLRALDADARRRRAHGTLRARSARARRRRRQPRRDRSGPPDGAGHPRHRRTRATYPHIFFREHCADMGARATATSTKRYIASSRALAVTGTHLSTPSRRAPPSSRRFAGRGPTTRARSSTSTIDRCCGSSPAPATASRASSRPTDVTAALQRCCRIAIWSSAPRKRSRSPAARPDMLAALQAIRERTPAPIVLKRGAERLHGHRRSRAARSLDDGVRRAAAFAVEVLNVLGAGDAFLSGLPVRLARGEPLPESARARQRLRRAGRRAVMAARRRCRAASSSTISSRAPPTSARPDLDDRLEHICITRRPCASVARRAVRARVRSSQPARTARATRPARRARHRALQGSDRRRGRASRRAGPRTASALGVIVDARHGSDALNRLTRSGLVDRPADRGAGFAPARVRSATTTRRCTSRPGRPRTSSSASSFYHPDDPIELRLAQEQRAARAVPMRAALGSRPAARDHLQRRRTAASTTDTLARALAALLQPRRAAGTGGSCEPQTPAAWRSHRARHRRARSVVQRHPAAGARCAGGDAAPRASRTSRGIELCRGFAVGRSIFNAAARGVVRGQR